MSFVQFYSFKGSTFWGTSVYYAAQTEALFSTSVHYVDEGIKSRAIATQIDLNK